MGEKLLYTVDEAVQLLGIGRTMIYALINDGSLRTVKIGRSRRISADALQEFADGLRSGAYADWHVGVGPNGMNQAD